MTDMRISTLLGSAAILLTLTGACTNPETQSGTDAAPPASQVHGDLRQVMRGVLFPNSNVIFAVQSTDPTTLKQAADPATATDPLISAYGGWTAVENSALAIAESANLLTVAGRQCANGKPVPVSNPDWIKFVQELRDAGMAAFKAAQSKNQDNILEAAGVLTTACSNCHDKYREKPGGEADRCV